MKNLIIVLGLGLAVISCKKEDVKQKESIEAEVSTGTWKIISFIDSGVDETVHFAGYNFEFQDGGVLTASNGTNSYTGTWSVTDSNSNDDSPDDLDFNIYFNLTNDFQDLNDDWDITSHSSTTLELFDISGGNGGTDVLTFAKN